MAFHIAKYLLLNRLGNLIRFFALDPESRDRQATVSLLECLSPLNRWIDNIWLSTRDWCEKFSEVCAVYVHRVERGIGILESGDLVQPECPEGRC